jgi:hypothetical protein
MLTMDMVSCAVDSSKAAAGTAVTTLVESAGPFGSGFS